MRALLALSLVLSIPALAQDVRPTGHQHGKTLGTIVFPNSGNAAAQAPFLRGIALLHSFEYREAAEAFREAQRADPSLALAYWGEALTYSQVLWRTENLPASRTALQKLAPTSTERLAMARTARERAFGAAVEAFYAEGPLPQRIAAYADSLRRHAQNAPDDHEAAAFASHALMLASNAGEAKDRDQLAREAVDLAQKVAKANPNHPGATHYLIHLYDTPGMAAQGLAFARAYDKIAPDAEHALHMPSHIYLQLGLWADVARSNERAWAASRASTANAGLLDWHAFSWLQYSYLQQGRFGAARALIDSARSLLGGDLRGSYTDASFLLPRLEFQHAAETGQWSAPVARPRLAAGPPSSERERGFRVFANYWAAMDAAQRRDTMLFPLAAAYLAAVDSARAGSPRSFSPVMASNALLVRALVARARGDAAAYDESLRAAAALERTLNAFVGPPERVFALELLGADLSAAGRHEEAAKAYEDVLRICPERSQALLGLARAKAAVGDRAGADQAYARLRKNWADAEASVLALIPTQE
jgi:tetratricopeptide (TPR) repeat protein